MRFKTCSTMEKNKDKMLISLVDLENHEGHEFHLCSDDDFKGCELNIVSRREIKGLDIEIPSKEEFMKLYYGKE
mgnify:FL=1